MPELGKVHVSRPVPHVQPRTERRTAGTSEEVGVDEGVGWFARDNEDDRRPTPEVLGRGQTNGAHERQEEGGQSCAGT